MWRDLNTFDSFLDKLGGDFSFVFTNVGVAEEELAVQVRDVDGVHVDDMDVLEAGEGKVFKDLAAEATGTAVEVEYLDPKMGTGRCLHYSV